jgi:hypothetical protein
MSIDGYLLSSALRPERNGHGFYGSLQSGSEHHWCKRADFGLQRLGTCGSELPAGDSRDA